MSNRILQSGNAMRLSSNHAALSNSNLELVVALKQSLVANGTGQDEPHLSDGREEYEVTLKLFFTPETSAKSRAGYIAQCVETTTSQLRIDTVDLLILAFPGVVLDAEDEADAFDEESLEEIATVYKAGQDLVSQGKVLALGVSEFSARRLEQLYDKAAAYNDQGLPSVDQINLKDCCVMPADLMSFAKDRKVKLFTHGDLKEMLPKAKLDEIMQEVETKASYTPRWVSKVTCVVKSRGVVDFKGYAAMIEQ